jgi:hypothetical protein
MAGADHCHSSSPQVNEPIAQFKPAMDKIRVPRIGPGRLRARPDSVSADKAYSNRAIRHDLRRRKIRHCIPEKTDHRGHRLRRGSAGGRPPGFDARNTH